MTKKNRDKIRQRKSQKREAKARAKKKVFEITKGIVERMRKQGYHIPMQTGPDRMTHQSTDTVEIAKCDGVGECCRNVVVNLDPGDVWRILGNEKIKERYGAELTTDVCSLDEDKGLIYYWVDPRVGVPRCKMRHVKKEHGLIECILLEHVDGKPTCLLGDDRPTICRANPIGRIGTRDPEGNLTGWGFVLRDEPCRKCEVKEDGVNKVCIGEYLSSNGMDKRFSFLDLFYGLQAWIAKDVKVEEMRKLAAMICFDWDRFLIEVGGNSREEIKEVRPQSPEQVLVSARVIVDGIMRGENVVHAPGKPKEGEDGVATEGETVPPDPNG